MTSPDLLTRVAQALSEAPSGLSLSHLGRCLGGRQSKITAELSNLQDRGHVRFTGGRWRWIGPPMDDLTTTVRESPTKNTDLETGGRSSRWVPFRRLCAYYREYVRLGERQRINVYTHKAGEDFVGLRGGIDYASLERGLPITVFLQDGADAYLKSARSGRKLPHGYLGLPVDLSAAKPGKDEDDWVALEPVFLIPVTPEAGADDRVVLRPLGPVEVNASWLTTRFPKPSARRQFLIAAGLMEEVEEDEEGEVIRSYRMRPTSFRQALDALAEARKKFRREFLDLDQLDTSPGIRELRERGLYNRAVLVSQQKLKFANQLYRELDALADPQRVTDEALDRSALAHVFHGEVSAPAGTELPPSRAEFQALNHEQREAVDAGRNQPLTVLTGPPGTGKSVTVAHTMCNLALEGRRVLFASRNHQALDVVEDKLNELVAPDILVMRPARRSTEVERTRQWTQDALASITRGDGTDARTSAWNAVQEPIKGREKLESDLCRILDLHDEICDGHTALAAALEGLPEELRSRAKTGPDVPPVEEIDALLNQDKPAPVGDGSWFGRWIRILRGHRKAPDLSTRITTAVARFTGSAPADTDMPRLRALLESHRDFAGAASQARALHTLREQRRQLPGREELESSLESAGLELETRTRTALRALAGAGGTDLDATTRDAFHKLVERASKRGGPVSDKAFAGVFQKQLSGLLDRYRMWAVSNLSAYKAAPLEDGIFDLLIIDEASQCDIPSILPLLFRARRAMIVGDPRQLGHISDVSDALESQVRERLGIADDDEFASRSAARSSAYDFAAAAPAAHTIELKAHYRCHPDIAEYCNATFYKNALRVMTQVNRLKPIPGASDLERGIVWTEMESSLRKGTKTGCTDPQQADVVIREVDRLVQAGFDGSIGVITPFREQADSILELAEQSFTDEQREQIDFHCHTVDGFQGDERDLILFSLVGGRDMPEGSLAFLGQAPNRFNVAISRARSRLHIFGDRAWARRCLVPHIRKLAKYGDKERKPPTRSAATPSGVWEERLAAALLDAGLPLHRNHLSCGYDLRVALLEGKQRLDIEVDGETRVHAPERPRHTSDLYRSLVLRRTGWHVMRLEISELKEDIYACVQRIRATWGQLRHGD